MPDEMKGHLTNPYTVQIERNRYTQTNYQPGDDIISGSGEEDYPLRPNFPFFTSAAVRKARSLGHFWEPDNSRNGVYDDGLDIDVYGNQEASFRRARDYWLQYVIPYYVSGDIDRSYYWLGRVAHLIEDASVPAHVLLDCHPDDERFAPHCEGGSNDDQGRDDSALERYTRFPYIFANYTHTTAGAPYKYEFLIPGFSESNWRTVDSNFSDTKYLFRLMWYTAQKAQYFASDNKEQDFTYNTTNNVQQNWACSGTSNNLWADQGLTSCSDFVTMNELRLDDPLDTGPNVKKEADALIPHAMRAVAGLYRLFTHEVNIDWPFFHHNVRRTGVTYLPGDYRKNNIQNVNLVLDNSDNFVSRMVIADIDGNGLQEVIVSTTKQNVGGKVYSVEKNVHDQTTIKWSYNSGRTIGSPAVANLDDDLQKEILYASPEDYKLWRLDVAPSGTSVTRDRFFTAIPKPDPKVGLFWPLFRGDIKDAAIADLDNDGHKEVIFADYRTSLSPDWNGYVYVTDSQGALNSIYIVGNGGTNGGISIANVDSDARLEIIVPSTYGIYVLNYNLGGFLSKKWSNTDGAILGSVAVYDFGDGDLKLIYTTTNAGSVCDITKTCTNTLYIRRAEDGSLNKSINLNLLDSRVTPTVADLDNDDVPEIVIVAKNSEFVDLGVIAAYDAVSGTQQWAYNDNNQLLISQISPDLVDINGNGDLEVVYAENDGSKVHILTGSSGAQWATYTFSGLIGSALAIGDIDNDRKAEIAVKHAGLADVDTTELSSLTDENNVPDLNRTENLTYDEGDTIDLTPFVNASDFNSDPVEIIYEAPFDSSGQWKADCQTVGNYTFFVEASDPMNLSDIKDFNVQINPTCPVHENIDEVTGIEGETINITVNASDPQGDPLTYVINDSRFTQENNIFRWATQDGDEGELIVNINVSDGNPLHVDSFDVKIIVFDKATNLLDVFNDSKTDDLLVFNTPGEQKSVSVRLKKNVDVVYSTITMEGLPP
ncbi:VCBS repeat-containing protein [Candidatus Woesearchaeota archaeon]|nr:VCBS repeat-containing protein [Candidatus Woesearchaeota archaeon]